MFGSPDRRALIVEDDVSSREALAAFLRRRGVQVVCAATLASARAKFDGEVTHLILDLRLPDGSGLSLVEKAHEEGRSVKVAIVTGVDQGDVLADAAMAHPDVFLRKPIDFSDVFSWMEGRPHLDLPPSSLH